MELMVLTIVSCLLVVFIARFSLKSRKPNPIGRLFNVIILITLVSISMLIGKYGATWGFQWWLYYPIPMLLTIIIPVVYFKMDSKEMFRYIILTIISAPVIHIFFSLLGWKNYMPFLEVPSIYEIF